MGVASIACGTSAPANSPEQVHVDVAPGRAAREEIEVWNRTRELLLFGQRIPLQMPRPLNAHEAVYEH